LKEITTWHIHIKGQVQGVGFRPFVYQLAQQYRLAGWVNNTSDGVHIEFIADEFVAHDFYQHVISEAPALSRIIDHRLEQTDCRTFEGFKILPSSNKGEPVVQLSPDFALCENCRKEIKEVNNRRYQYAFTTCTECGPRYSIIKELPYDRENTAMADFEMCSRCRAEYDNPNNRRHYSQTNSCPDCRIVLQLYDNNNNLIEENQQSVLDKICALWEAGKIIAVKGIGGYLLTCDASNAEAIKKLRLRKNRPTKPFALMFPDISSSEKEAFISKTELATLSSPAAPIVLLQMKSKVNSTLALHDIAPRLSQIGVMLPYAPLYELLLQKFQKPIVATSGNSSNAAIIYQNEKALDELAHIADYVLIHNREIISPQDDSVICCSKFYEKRMVLRRARGYAPLYINGPQHHTEKTILATGALLKSTFTLLHQQNLHISQYLGDTDNFDAQKIFEYVTGNYLKLFKAQPEVILTDKHPDYFTTQFGKKIARERNCKLVAIQHHEAHFAAVLGEHQLFDETQPVLGVIWDGTGLGDDGQIWGGEFFIYHNKNISRVAHFEYFNHFLGDKMAVEPRLSAFALCHNMEEALPVLQPKFTATEWINYQTLIENNQLKTSSVGRLFDAATSLLGLIDKSSYEGEAAMLLEEEALKYFADGLSIPSDWIDSREPEQPLSTQSIIASVVKKIGEGKSSSEIAAWFHVHLVITIQKVAIEDNCSIICCSGGVFQNELLVDLLVKLLGGKYRLYFNKDLSPNDENISFGQMMWYLHKRQQI